MSTVIYHLNKYLNCFLQKKKTNNCRLHSKINMQKYIHIKLYTDHYVCMICSYI